MNWELYIWDMRDINGESEEALRVLVEFDDSFKALVYNAAMYNQVQLLNVIDEESPVYFRVFLKRESCRLIVVTYKIRVGDIIFRKKFQVHGDDPVQFVKDMKDECQVEFIGNLISRYKQIG